MKAIIVLAAMAALAGAVPAAVAQRPGGQSPDAVYRYRVRPGDTLPKLTAAFLADPAAAGTVARANGVGGRLVPGTTLSIPLSLLRTQALSARVIAFRGDVTIGRQGPARLGMTFGEGIRIATGAGSSVSFRLTDGTAVTLPSLSAIRIVRLRRVLISGQVQRVLALDEGRSESRVTPSRDGQVSYEIRTPVSVAAVRGTVFRVTYAANDHAATAGVLRGAVQVDGADRATGGGVALPVGFGARSDQAGPGTAVRLLPPPDITGSVRRRRDGTLIVTIRKMAAARAYRIVVAGDAAFGDVLAEATGTSEQVAVPPLPDGTYYLRATAIDASGIEGLPADYPYDHGLRRAPAPRSGG